MKHPLFRLIVILTLFVNCKQKNVNYISSEDQSKQQNSIVSNNEERGREFLTDFYAKYYGENLDRKGIENYVSSRILKRMDSLSEEDNLILDYDPFIKGQDYDWKMIKKTLIITPLKNKNEFRASFKLFGEKDEQRTNIDFLLKKDANDKFLIYSILNDEYLNFIRIKRVVNNNTEKSNNPSNNYSIIGTWKYLCDDARDLRIETDKEIFLVVQGNQIAINMIKLDKSTENEYYYKLDKKPLSMGSGGNSLPWNTFLNDTEIAKIKVLNNNQIEFTWLGFYNSKTKEREMTDCEFTINSGENPVILNKCKL